MAVKLDRKKVVGLKSESTQGSAATLGATDFIIASDVEIAPAFDSVERDYEGASLDTKKSFVGKRWYQMSFRTELKGSGTAGVEYDPLDAAFLACGFVKVIDAGASITYWPTSDAGGSMDSLGNSCTIQVFIDGFKHQMVGSLGSFRCECRAGQIAMLDFTFQGEYSAVSDAGMPTTTYLPQLPELVVSTSLDLQGQTVTASAFEFEVGNEVGPRDDMNAAAGVAGLIITNRTPIGSCDPEALPIATHDFPGKFISGAEASSSIQVGSGIGNRTTITMPKTQYSEIPYGDRNGLLTFDLGLRFNQTDGDDWVNIKIDTPSPP